MTRFLEFFKNHKQKVTIAAAVTVIILTIFVIMVRYSLKGEKNIPFSISKLMVVSTVTGVQKEDATNLWDLRLNQNNDIYMSISKNEKNSKKAIIKSISIENFTVVVSPQKGEISIYRPAAEGLYKDLEEYRLSSKLEYSGASQADIKNLKIANQGGVILFRISNRNVGEFISNEVEEVKLDASLIENSEITLEEIKAKVSFDVVIEVLDDMTYKANMEIELPVGNLLEEGTSYIEKTDFSDVIFKRI